MAAAPGTAPSGLRVAIIGGGWAGLAAAVAATEAGHAVVVFESSRTLGGRARSVELTAPSGETYRLDNGQHILIGAYVQTLALMRKVEVDPRKAFLRKPLDLRFADGQGIALPRWPAPLDMAWGILRAKGWTWAERKALIRTAQQWRKDDFACPPDMTVATLCAALPSSVREGLIDPLCVSALNTPSHQASAQVFLRVLDDAMFSVSGGSHLLLPRMDLGRLFPEAAAAWLASRGGSVRMAARVQGLQKQAQHWLVGTEPFDRVLLACPPWEAARIVGESVPDATGWAAQAEALHFEAIATVYCIANTGLPRPMLALKPADGAPAQFAFDRGQLGGPHGLLAFVVSASRGEREEIQQQVLKQATDQLGCVGIHLVQPVQTVIEKRATFACTPGLQRPAQRVAPGLTACGDYVEGPYPATIEGAVRSALDAVALLDAAR